MVLSYFYFANMHGNVNQCQYINYVNNEYEYEHLVRVPPWPKTFISAVHHIILYDFTPLLCLLVIWPDHILYEKQQFKPFLFIKWSVSFRNLLRA